MASSCGGVPFEYSEESCRKSTPLTCCPPHQRIGIAMEDGLQCNSENSSAFLQAWLLFCCFGHISRSLPAANLNPPMFLARSSAKHNGVQLALFRV